MNTKSNTAFILYNFRLDMHNSYNTCQGIVEGGGGGGESPAKPILIHLYIQSQIIKNVQFDFHTFLIENLLLNF